MKRFLVTSSENNKKCIKEAIDIPLRASHGLNESMVHNPSTSSNSAQEIDKITNNYLFDDDIVVYSEGPDQHLNHLQRVLERLQSYGLTCQPKKCTFGVTQIKFLGHVVDGEGIDREPEKLTAIQELPVPKKTKDVLRELGVCGWYSQFVPHYAEITAPLTSLLAKGTKWRWSEIEQEAFWKLKESLV
ncbi:uncharacterized protein LOC111037108 [Myzus persicae]|uniref:uncharacterized protein LOC111037108 n=1 Tax=Myzus persicae TaxID=13164 RepID=UPI000B9315EE|nr:uncharacterized protein LOC111037108 [Myzus persicae]